VHQTQVPLTNGGVAKLKIKATMPGAPRVFANGVEIFTTPQPALGLVFLAVLPVLSLTLIRGAIGFGLAFGGLALAIGVARKDAWSTRKRALSIVGIAAATWGVAFVLFVAVTN
jgi:hypothetical protein